MKSLLSTVLVVVAVLSMMASSATVAQADILYAGWMNMGGVKAYDLATGTELASFTTIPRSAEGLAISPVNGYLYLSDDRYGDIYRYNPTTGAQIDDGAWVSLAGRVRGLCFDSLGNLYAARDSDNTITKIASDSTITEGWGSSMGTDPSDLEIYDGKLYGGQYGTGVVFWDLGDGTPGTLVSDSYRVDGLTFSPDGTLYTATKAGSEYNREAREWDGTYQLANSTLIKYEETTPSYGDIDYYKGYYYLKTAFTVEKYDPDTDGTWTTFCSSGGSETGPRFLVIGVPEPGTLTLLGMGLVGLLCYAWRRRK